MQTSHECDHPNCVSHMHEFQNLTSSHRVVDSFH